MQARRERHHITIRQRITFAMILLAVGALLASGLILFVTERQAVDARVDGYLSRAKDELRVLASEGVDPVTGQRFAGASELLRTYLSRTVVSPHEGELGTVNGRIRWVASDDVLLRPEDDSVLVEHLLPLSQLNTISVGTVSTPQREYRYTVTPVKYPDGDGALAHVYDMDAANSELMHLVVVFALVASGATVMISVVAWLLVGRLLRPVEALRSAAEAISEHDLTSRVPEAGSDDLTRLSVAMNRMLDRVQRSVEGQRQLLDDVGHELRTPITVVRGHLELVDAHDPSDVTQTKALAIDELDRMSELVNDLLLLAKATHSDFVKPRWTSLADLTDLTLEKARGLGARQWRLRHIVAADAWLDPNRIQQAWLQLVANAVKYSDENSTIALGSELTRGEVRLSVADEGIGIAPAELSVIRQRFARAKNAEQHAVGAGLGLAIVELITDAHRGRLEIDSELGVGSTFTICLPLSPSEGESP